MRRHIHACAPLVVTKRRMAALPAIGGLDAAVGHKRSRPDDWDARLLEVVDDQGGITDSADGGRVVALFTEAREVCTSSYGVPSSDFTLTLTMSAFSQILLRHSCAALAGSSARTCVRGTPTHCARLRNTHAPGESRHTDSAARLAESSFLGYEQIVHPCGAEGGYTHQPRRSTLRLASSSAICCRQSGMLYAFVAFKDCDAAAGHASTSLPCPPCSAFCLILVHLACRLCGTFPWILLL